jgi:hypothetical protein
MFTKRFFLSLAVMLWFVLAAVGFAFAVDSAVPAAVSPSSGAVGELLRQTVFPIITALFLGVVSLFLKKLGDKLGVQSLADRNGLLMTIAAQGVAFAEEKAAIYADSRLPLSGSDKLTAATSYILKAMPKVTQEQAEAATHAILAMIPGAGATGSASYTPSVPKPEIVPLEAFATVTAAPAT